MYMRTTNILSIGAVAGAIACASMTTGCGPQELEDGVSVQLEVGMHEPAIAGGKALGFMPMAGVLPFGYTDIASIRIDIRETATDQYLYTNIWLEQSAGNWVGTIPYLPAGKELDFIATAYDVDDVEIFNGNTLRTFISGESNAVVTVVLAPVDDGKIYPMPRIVEIRYREEFASGQDDIVSFAIEGEAGATISYEITASGGGPAPFLPASGAITLAGTAGQFVSTYSAPEVTAATDIAYEVTLTGEGGTRVRTVFVVTVVPPEEGGGATNTKVQVLYNPVINEVITARTPETNDVVWEAVVSDDGDASTLTYQWTFTPNETFSPAPALTGMGQTNPVTLQNYTEAVHGTMRLDVTDADGGLTTLFYTVLPEQFPRAPEVPGEPTGLRVIRGGDNHTCALFNDGGVRCWGRNDSGQLGYGHALDIGDDELPSTVSNVPLPADDPATDIAVGYNHTCALLKSGYVRCWGDNAFGQLGLGHTENVGDGEVITSLLGGIVNLGGIVKGITAGGDHTCALMDTGSVRCWGKNDKGQLGYAHTNAIGDDEAVWSAGEVVVGGTVIDIAAGEQHTCALLATGKVRCWGYGAYGRLGYGNSLDIGDDENPSAAGDVDVGGTVKQIEAGGKHTCALLETGYMRCWGHGAYGQLGYGNGTYYGDNEPPSSAGDVDTRGIMVAQITAGEDHTCALLSTSEVKCWGFHYYGRLGYGSTDHNAPASSGVDLGGNSAFLVMAGGRHTCALLDTGKAWCWGLNNYGQLGYGHTSTISSPPAGGDVPLIAP